MKRIVGIFPEKKKMPDTDIDIDRMIDQVVEAENRAWNSMREEDYDAAKAKREELMNAIAKISK